MCSSGRGIYLDRYRKEGKACLRQRAVQCPWKIDPCTMFAYQFGREGEKIADIQEMIADARVA